MARIKTTCPAAHGGCGRQHFLNVPDDLDEEGRAHALTFAKLTGCRPCSIWQESRLQLEDVESQNQSTIWKYERERDHIKGVLLGEPKNAGALNSRLSQIERVIQVARADLVLALREIGRLDEARAEQLQELQLTETVRHIEEI